MKFAKGTIGNVNKRLIVGALSLTLLTTTLSGCGFKIDDVNYIRNEQGYIDEIDGTISYEFLSNYCIFCKVQNNLTGNEYYTIAYRPSKVVPVWNSYTYFNIFNNQNLKTSNNTYNEIDNVENYLIELNMFKSEYTEEDLRQVLNMFIKMQENKQNKEYVKTN